MKTTALITILAAMAALDAHAGSGKATVPPVTPPEDPLFTGSLSVGYDTEYYFRGLWFSSNNVWGGLNLSIPLADKLSLGLGGLYTYSADTDISGTGNLDYSELDLIASLNYDAGFARFGLVFTNYSFFDTFSGSTSSGTFGFPEAPDSTLKDARDLGLTMAVPLGNATIYLGGYWDFRIEAPYFEVGADYTIKITESFSLVPSANIGYGNNYYSYPEIGNDKSGFTAVRVGLAAPYKLTNSFTITPYIAGNLALDTREGLNTVRGANDLFGGVAMSYAF
jgi:hypothetical protein